MVANLCTYFLNQLYVLQPFFPNKYSMNIDFFDMVVYTGEQVTTRLVFQNLNSLFYSWNRWWLCVFVCEREREKERERERERESRTAMVYIRWRYIFSEPCFFVPLSRETDTERVFNLGVATLWLAPKTASPGYSADCFPRLTAGLKTSTIIYLKGVSSWCNG